jgi:hypothetical protein
MPSDAGRYKFVNLEEARAAWSTSRERIRIVDNESFVAHRIAGESLQVDLLRLKLARTRDELVSRRASNELMADAAALLAREIQTTLPSWAEELYAVARTGNIPATTQ